MKKPSKKRVFFGSEQEMPVLSALIPLHLFLNILPLAIFAFFQSSSEYFYSILLLGLFLLPLIVGGIIYSVTVLAFVAVYLVIRAYRTSLNLGDIVYGIFYATTAISFLVMVWLEFSK